GKAVVDADTAIKRIRSAVDARRDENFLIMARLECRPPECTPADAELPGADRHRGVRNPPQRGRMFSA
ncbi:hypothetical protein AB0O65_08165, partial [Microbacterium sp. NPDC077391]